MATAVRIWLVNHYAVPGDVPGGARTFMFAKYLARWGHDVTIVAATFGHKARRDVSPGVTGRIQQRQVDGVRFVWLRTPGYAGNSWSRLRNMIAFARGVKALDRSRLMPSPEVVLGSSPHLFAALAAQRTAARNNVPFVLEIRDVWPLALIEEAGVSRWHPLVFGFSAIERYLYRRSDRIVALPPDLSKYLVGKGVAERAIVWIPNGVDLADLPPYSSPPRRRGIHVVYVGAHGVANAVDRIVDVAGLVAARDPEDTITFELVGDGPEKARLVQQAQDKALSNLVFTDPIPKNEVPAILAGADVCIATTKPSARYEGGISFNKLYDYLAAGRPIVFGVDSDDNPVAEAGAGFCCDPNDLNAMADAIVRMRDLSQRDREEMGRRGRAYVEESHDVRMLAGHLNDLLATLGGTTGAR